MVNLNAFQLPSINDFSQTFKDENFCFVLLLKTTRSLETRVETSPKASDWVSHTLSVGAQAQLGRISPIWENSPKWENKIWVQIGDFLPNGRTLLNKALCRLRGTFAGDKNMFNGFLSSNYPSSPSTSKFHRLLIE